MSRDNARFRESSESREKLREKGSYAKRLPDKIGPYTVVGELGRGTFAEAFHVRAEDGSDLPSRAVYAGHITHS